MAKSRETKIKEILHPKEKILYKGKINAGAYILPVAVMLSGILLHFFPDAVVQFLPAKHQAGIGNIIYDMQQVHFGGLLLIVSLVLFSQIFRAHRYSMHIVTVERVISVTGIFVKKKKFFYLNRIGRIVSKQSMFDRFLAKGKVIIYDKQIHTEEQKEKELDRMIMENVARPAKMRQVIIHAVKNYAGHASHVEEMHTKKRLGVKVKVD